MGVYRKLAFIIYVIAGGIGIAFGIYSAVTYGAADAYNLVTCMVFILMGLAFVGLGGWFLLREIRSEYYYSKERKKWIKRRGRECAD